MLSYFIAYNRYLNIIGIAVILGIAWLFSKKRWHVDMKLVFTGLAMQCAIGFLVLRTSIGRTAIEWLSSAVQEVYLFADAGSRLIFGNLTDPSQSWGFIFGFKVLPVIIFFGALMSLLFYLGIVQRIVLALNYVICPLLGTSGAETLCAISNSFLGQTEAPLLIRNYLKDMTQSEMLVVMVSGMGTISGAILVVFASMGVSVEHLLASSVMAIPATIVIAKILYPETEEPKTASGSVNVVLKSDAANVFDAISSGTVDGLHLALNVAAMLISFLALLAMINGILGYIGVQLNHSIGLELPTLSLDYLFSYLFAPFGYLLGFTGAEIFTAGKLLGTKVAVNELIAFSQLVTSGLSERSANIITYALCGFSNFSCIGIQVGGIGALVPEKRAWLTQLGLYAVLGGALANLLSAMVAGLLL